MAVMMFSYIKKTMAAGAAGMRGHWTSTNGIDRFLLHFDRFSLFSELSAKLRQLFSFSAQKAAFQRKPLSPFGI